jgi:methionyl aminopeptidase
MNHPAGPNDPCHCGSGRKYKKCHMAADRVAGVGSLSASGLRRTLSSWMDRRSGGGVAIAAPTRRVTAGEISPMRSVPDHILRPEYAESGEPGNRRNQQLIKNREALARMRRACIVAREVLDVVLDAVKPGITTDELDEICHEETIRRGGYPSPLNYQGFPKSLCTSINEVVCHGIPSSFRIEDGDIVNCDVTVYIDGMHGDNSETVYVGEVDAESRKLVEDTYHSMMAGIAAVRPGGQIRDIGREIERYINPKGYGIVRSFAGHGVGELFHMEPSVSHFYESSNRFEMRPGMTFTVEPMINQGDWRCVMWDDEWTAVTADLRRSAQFEHTVLVTNDGYELLTTLGAKPRFMG